MASDRVSQQAFLAISALLFAASAALTIHWCASMSAMGGMPIPGGWAMSMAWMRMPGQTWPVAAASFLGMWVVMMVPNNAAFPGPHAESLPPGRRQIRVLVSAELAEESDIEPLVGRRRSDCPSGGGDRPLKR